MRRLSFLPSRRIQNDASVRSLYGRAARGWQKGIERIGYGQAYADLSRHARSLASSA